MQEIIEKFKKQGWLTEKDIKVLRDKKIVNWIWGENASLKHIIDDILDLPYFEADKYQELFEDIERISIWHDISYFIPWNYLDFTKANIIFSWRLYKLLCWTRWYKRIWIAMITFIVLQIHWKKYFNWE